MQRKNRIIMAAAAAAISTVSFWQFKADGATFTWDGGGADDSLSTPANWVNDVAPGSTGADDWVFTGNVRTSPLNDYAPPRFALGFTSVFNIFFDANAAAFTLGGGTITMGNTAPAGGNITNNSAFTQTFNTGVSPRTGTIAANTADIVFNGSFSAGNTPNNQGGRGSTIAGAHNVFFNGPIFNGGFLVINGTGTTFISADNSAASPAGVWNGTVTINTGNLHISNSNALGDIATNHGTTVSGGANTGALQIDGTAGALTVNEPITLGGRTVFNPEISNFAGNNTLNNVLTSTNGGGTSYNLDSAAGKLTVAVLNMTGTTGSRTIALSGAGDGEIGSISLTSTSTTAGLVKSGTGTWTLDANVPSFLLGSATISAGTLVVQPNTGTTTTSAGALGNAPGSVLTVAAGGTLDASAYTSYSLQAGSAGISGQKLVGGGVIKVGGAFQRFGDNTINPGTEGGAGTLTIQGDLSLSNQFAIAGNGLRFDLSSTPTSLGGTNDRIAVQGNLFFDSAGTAIPILVNPIDLGLGNGTYTLINYTGSFNGDASSFALSGTPTGTTRQSLDINTSTAGQVNLVVGGEAATVDTWVGNSGNTWDVKNTPNWTSSAATNPNLFFNLDSVVFNDTASNKTIQLDTTVFPSSITVDTAQTYLIQGGGTISNGAAITKNGTGTFILANTGMNDFTGDVTINSGTLQVGNGGAVGGLGGGSVNNNANLVINTNSAVTLPNAISGSGQLILRGSGTTTLSASSAYSGATTVESGQLLVTNGNALGTAAGATTISTGAEFAIINAITVPEPLTISGAGLGGAAGAIHAGGAIASTLSGPITLAGDSTIKVDAGSTLNLTNNLTATDHTLTVNTDTGAAATISGSISFGAGGVIKSGPGTLVLSGSNTYSGQTQVQAGRLQVANAAALGDTVGNTVVSSGGEIAAFNAQTIGENFSLAGTGIDAGSGALHSGGAAASTFNGNITLTGDTQLKADGGSTLRLNGSVTGTDTNLTLVADGGAAVIFGGPVSLGTGGVTKNSNGTWRIASDSNSWSGATTINNGTLQLGEATNSLTGTLPTATTVNLVGAATGTAIVFSHGNDITVPNLITGSGGVAHVGTGTLILSNTSNSYQGETRVDNGELRVTAAGELGDTVGDTFVPGNELKGHLAITGDITLDEPITLGARQATSLTTTSLLNVSGNNTLTNVSGTTGGSNYNIESAGGLLTISSNLPSAVGTRVWRFTGAAQGVVSGNIAPADASSTVSVIKAGTGTWTLSGSNSYNGVTTVQNGTLVLQGDNAQAPVISPTLGGADIQGGRLTFSGGAGATPATISSLLSASFHATGSFNNTTERLRSSTSTGTLGLGMTYDGASNTTVGFTVFGDANLDGNVNALDFNALATGFGNGTFWYQGDFNYDGAVTTSDFTVMSQNFGLLAPTPTAAPVLTPALGTLVPEPATVGLMFAAAGMMLGRRRRAAK